MNVETLRDIIMQKWEINASTQGAPNKEWAMLAAQAVFEISEESNTVVAIRRSNGDPIAYFFNQSKQEVDEITDHFCSLGYLVRVEKTQ